MQCKWQVEIDLYCQKVLAKHWPDVRRWDDVRTFPPEGDWSVDVICGGFPCKQTSTAAAISGNRHGLAGRDSGLWFEMLRVVQLVGPRIVVVENVAGADTWSETIKGGLASLGYIVPRKPMRLPASLFGAPHSRKRLFWIADFDGAGLEIARQANALAADGIEGRTTDGNDWLATLSGVQRVADGLPGGLERRNRIERLGNSVCPAVSEWIGRRLMEAESVGAALEGR